MAATIAWVSDGEQAKPRRRRGRRRGRGAAGAAETHAETHKEDQPTGGPTATTSRPSRSSRRMPERLRTVHETSAGGLVIDGIDGPRDEQVAALIGRIDRRGRMLWSLPKGHIELGETAEQTAIREVAEETGYSWQRAGRAGTHRLLVRHRWTSGAQDRAPLFDALLRRRAVRRRPRSRRSGLGADPGIAVPAGLRRRTPAGRGGRRADQTSCRTTVRPHFRRCRPARPGVARRHIRAPGTSDKPGPGRKNGYGPGP